MQTATQNLPRRSGWGLLAIALVVMAVVMAFIVVLFAAGALFLSASHVHTETQPTPSATSVIAPAALEVH